MLFEYYEGCLTVEFFAFGAFHGDAFLVSNENTVVLVDGGMPSTYGEITRVIKGKRLDAIFITHVDQDHIGGAIKLLADRNNDLSGCTVFMNHPELVAYDYTNLVAYHHGDTLKELALRRDLTFCPVDVEKEIKVGDFSVLVLSPSKSDVKELHHNWNASQVIQDGQLTYQERQVNNNDIINRSSIAKILTHDGISLLLLGDSHPEVICAKLSSLQYDHDNPIKLDLVKLSHHGSQHSTSPKLLSYLECVNYYVSTNGGRYSHPDKETIEMLQGEARRKNKIYNIYLNYDIESDIRRKCAIDLPNLRFHFEKKVVLPI